MSTQGCTVPSSKTSFVDAWRAGGIKSSEREDAHDSPEESTMIYEGALYLRLHFAFRNLLVLLHETPTTTISMGRQFSANLSLLGGLVAQLTICCDLSWQRTGRRLLLPNGLQVSRTCIRPSICILEAEFIPFRAKHSAHNLPKNYPNEFSLSSADWYHDLLHSTSVNCKTNSSQACTNDRSYG